MTTTIHGYPCTAAALDASRTIDFDVEGDITALVTRRETRADMLARLLDHDEGDGLEHGVRDYVSMVAIAAIEDQLDDDEIEAWRIAAGEHGDHDMVATCRRATDGDVATMRSARWRIACAIDDARAAED